MQVPGLAEAAGDEGGPGGAGVTKYIAPRALLWFRWAALLTWVSGAIYLLERRRISQCAFMLGTGDGDPVYGLTIGIGAWMGTIMLFNVWILIWPNQKKVLGIVEVQCRRDRQVQNASLFSPRRTNTMLSMPMMMSMVGAHHGFFM